MYSIVQQDQTEVYKDDDGAIIIQQWDPQEGAYSAVRFDRVTVPIIIQWLQELIAPEAA